MRGLPERWLGGKAVLVLYSDKIIFIIEIIGTIAFASAGALVAIRKEMDIFGVNILAVTTACGGGLIRDLIIGRKPPVMFREPIYTLVAIVTATLLFFVIYRREHVLNSRLMAIYEKLMVTCDAVGLGVFTVVGTNAAFEVVGDRFAFLQIFVGVLTGVGGGILRDLMAGQTPFILKREIYACASLAGAVACTYICREAPTVYGMFAGGILTIILRLLAAYYHWNLPRIRIEKDPGEKQDQ